MQLSAHFKLGYLHMRLRAPLNPPLSITNQHLHTRPINQLWRQLTNILPQQRRDLGCIKGQAFRTDHIVVERHNLGVGKHEILFYAGRVLCLCGCHVDAWTVQDDHCWKRRGGRVVAEVEEVEEDKVTAY